MARRKRKFRRSFWRRQAKKNGLDPNMSNASIRDHLQIKGIIPANKFKLEQLRHDMSLTKEQRKERDDRKIAFEQYLRNVERGSDHRWRAIREKYKSKKDIGEPDERIVNANVFGSLFDEIVQQHQLREEEKKEIEQPPTSNKTD